MLPDRVRRFVEQVLPWYDPQQERLRAERIEAMRLRSIRARIEAERIRAGYIAYADRLTRR